MSVPTRKQRPDKGHAMGMTCEVHAVSAEQLAAIESDPALVDELIDLNDPNASHCSLEKAWHGLHYLLTGQAAEADPPLNFIVAGGNEIAGSDTGYGPARGFAPANTKELSLQLTSVSDDQLWSRFDAKMMGSLGIYPDIWDEPESELREEYTMYFQIVKQLISDAAARDEGLIVVLL